MADPLSICASVIAVATLAFESCKTLYEVVHKIKDAPKTMADLSTDIQALQGVLNSLKSELEKHSIALKLSNGQLSVVKELGLPLQSCSNACNEFKGRLSKILSHSQDGHTSFRDRLKMPIYEKEISAFRFRLGSYKSTLNIAISCATMQATSSNQQAVQNLETQLLETKQLLSGQMQGLAMSVQDIISIGNEARELIQKTESQVAVLAQCLVVCMTAWSECSQSTGVTAKYVKALDDSRQLMGNIGVITGSTPEVKIDVLIAQDRAKQMVGNIEGKIALAFMNAPVERNGARGEASDTLPMPPMSS